MQLAGTSAFLSSGDSLVLYAAPGAVLRDAPACDFGFFDGITSFLVIDSLLAFTSVLPPVSAPTAAARTGLGKILFLTRICIMVASNRVAFINVVAFCCLVFPDFGSVSLSPVRVLFILHVADGLGFFELLEALCGLLRGPLLHSPHADLLQSGFLQHGCPRGGVGAEELPEGLQAGQESVDGASDVYDFGGRDRSSFCEVVNECDDCLGLAQLDTPRSCFDDIHQEQSNLGGRLLHLSQNVTETHYFKLLFGNGISVHFGKAGFAALCSVSVGLLLSEDLLRFQLGVPEFEFLSPTPSFLGDIFSNVKDFSSHFFTIFPKVFSSFADRFTGR